MLKEFKEFTTKGNVMDLAVAVIMGTAFGAIITALTDKILMPIVGSFVGQRFDTLSANVNGVDIHYGAFIQAIINFLLIAFFLFLMIKAINVTKKKKEEVPTAPAGPSSTDKLLMEIRDVLKK